MRWLIVILLLTTYHFTFAQLDTKDSILYSKRVRMGADFGLGYSWLKNNTYEPLTITGRSINLNYWFQIPIFPLKQNLFVRLSPKLSNQYYSDFFIKRDTLPTTKVIGSSFTVLNPSVSLSYYPFDNYWGNNPISIHAGVGLYTLLSYHNQNLFVQGPNYKVSNNYSFHAYFMRGWQAKDKRNYVNLFLGIESKYYEIVFPLSKDKNFAHNLVGGISFYSKPPLKKKPK